MENTFRNNGSLRPGIVHRIDRDTSGLIIAAKNDLAHQSLAEQLQDHSLYREYEAVCTGNLKEDSGHGQRPHWPATRWTGKKWLSTGKTAGRR